MNIKLFITEAVLLFILTFIYCALKVSSRESYSDEENN